MVEQEGEQTVSPDSQIVVPHLEIVQSVIARMAQNSAMTKTWCATLVAAILVLVARTGSPYYALIGLLPRSHSVSSTRIIWPASVHSATPTMTLLHDCIGMNCNQARYIASTHRS